MKYMFPEHSELRLQVKNCSDYEADISTSFITAFKSRSFERRDEER